MLKTRSKTCGQPYGEPHPARNRKDAGERPQPKYSDVTKPRYRGGCTAYYRCFQAPAPGTGGWYELWRKQRGRIKCGLFG